MESPPHCMCYFTLGHSLPMKRGWWWRAISLAANQCHCAETFQETIPTYRNDTSTLDLLLTENTNTEDAPLGVIYRFNQSVFTQESVRYLPYNTSLGALVKASFLPPNV